nr:alpha B crystallin fragment 5 [human, muscle, Peptide Partial, 12 aa] [Homo sapiens]
EEKPAVTAAPKK